MALTDMLLSRIAAVVLALLLGVILLLWVSIGDTLSGTFRTLLGVAAAGLCVLFFSRLIMRFSRVKNLPILPLARPPLRWERREQFDPIDAGPQRASGYTGYTDSFSATMTVHRYLAALPTEEVRIAYCSLACAYLGERMSAPHPPSIVGNGERRRPEAQISTEEALGWLAGIHRDYPDNAPPDSSFVLHALENAVKNYANGRSLALQQAEMALATETLVAGLNHETRRRKLDAHRALCDLDLDFSRGLLRWGSDQGGHLGTLHNNARLAT